MLGALALPCLRVILFPGEARFLPALIDGTDEVFAEGGVDFASAKLVRAWRLGQGLFGGG